ncbi:MAG: CHAT domain-containing protein [Spirulina sp. DLM2.Bin59]|nr:MAG: CHAT domain-containing protein [Spirulina sp. DLM2.Bin59]
MNQLLNPETAMIHWQISPARITTFILLQDQPPIILAGHYEQRLQWQRWWERWSKQWENHRQRSGNPEENQQWFNELWPQLAELAALLDVGEIFNKLPPEIAQVILVPHQELHLLPLHLVINHPQFDHSPYRITYLPSAQMGLNLVDPDHGPENSVDLPLLTVAGTGSDLGGVDLEVTVVQQYFAGRHLEPGEATRGQLLAALEESVQIFHFAGESFWDGTLAPESGLKLGDGTVLSLGDLQGLTTRVPALVCLPGHSLHFPPDFELELEGLAIPTFFLKRGTMDVVVSLWPGTPGATMLLMGRFYQALEQSTTPAIALHQAQHWLKTLTYGELLQHYNQLLSHLEDASPRCLEQLKLTRDLTQEKAQRQGEAVCPYEHPYYWGGFILLGLPY